LRVRRSPIDGASPRAFFLNVLAALGALILAYGIEASLEGALGLPQVADFRVVYCGERAVLREHADPYRVEPLRSCEHDAGLEGGEPAWSVTPYPLPGYAAAAFAPLAFLPYRSAREAWIALLVLSFGLAAAAIATILEASAFAAGLVFAPTLGLLNLEYGEPVLVSVAAFCLAALALHARRPKLAAVAAALSLVEPHVGLPAALGVYAFAPGARRTLVVAVAILAALGLLTLGLATNLEYARGFLPAQARAELPAADQFSLSRLLYQFGVAPGTALLVGSVSYVCTTLAGLWFARVFVARSGTRAAYVLLPVATAMLGGPFIHDVQIAAAVPAALLLAERSWAARAAVALLALDWTAPLKECIVPAFAAAAGTSAVVLRDASPLQRAAYAGGAVAVVLALAVALPFSPQPPSRAAPLGAVKPGAIVASELSSIPWGLRIAANPSWSESGLRTAIVKIPIWTGLLLLPLSLLRASPQRRRLSAY
jgi:hypothetical protein